MPVHYWDKVASWTQEKIQENDASEETYHVRRDDILSLLALWFIMGLVKLPNAEMHFKVGIVNVMNLIGLDDKHDDYLPGMHKFNKLQANIQFNQLASMNERKDEEGKQDFLYLIRPLYENMQNNFISAWVPPKNLTGDESLWSFKGRTHLKRFMKDKPKKYGFLLHALCTLEGYFYSITMHHLPGKEKRKKRNLTEENLDKENRLQLSLQKRYGEQGAIIMRLVSKLKYNGHHIIGDNAFSSVQLALDLKKGVCPGLRVPKADCTGTQVMKKQKKIM